MDITEDEIPRVSCQVEYSSKSSGYIAYLDARHTDYRSYDYLHTETKERWDRYLRLSYSIKIISEAYDSQNPSKNKHDDESFLQYRRESSVEENQWKKEKKYDKNTHSYSIRSRCAPFLSFILLRPIQYCIFP